jgi:hypothetical protein
MSITPSAGSITVPAQSCVTIPIQVACPSNVPIGTTSCYQVSIFNHTTGRIFGCQGSVKRALKWCVIVDVATPIGINPVLTGAAHQVRFDVQNMGEPGIPEALSYSIVALAGDTDLPSAGLSLNGLPPGEPVFGVLDLSGGQAGEIHVDASYADLAMIGYDRIVVLADDGSGVLEPAGEAAVRSATPETLGPPDLDQPAPDPTAPLLLEVPNPFTRSDRIRFRVEGEGPQEVKLRLYDLLGRTAKVFYNTDAMPPGEYTVSWDTRDYRGQALAAGIYFLKLEIAGKVATAKVLVRN